MSEVLFEERAGKTPRGGDRSVVYYKDAKMNPVDKSKATSVEVVEYRGDKVVGRTYADINQE